jgi:hypothetical protein
MHGCVVLLAHEYVSHLVQSKLGALTNSAFAGGGIMEGLDGFAASYSRTTNGTLASVLDQGPEVEMQTELGTGGGTCTTKLAEELQQEQELRAQAEAESEDKGRRLAVRPSLRP